MPATQQDSLGRFVRPGVAEATALARSPDAPAAAAPAPECDAPVSPAPHAGATPPPPARRRRQPTQFKHFKVDALLSAEDRDAYEKLLADPNSTVKALRAWLSARGYRVCRSAVTRHRQQHHAEWRKLREASRMAATFCQITRKGGAGAVAEAAQGRFEMLLMQSLFQMADAPTLPPGEWQRWSKAVNALVATRRDVEAMRAEFDRKSREAAAPNEMAAKATPQQVVDRMRDILGLPRLGASASEADVDDRDPDVRSPNEL